MFAVFEVKDKKKTQVSSEYGSPHIARELKAKMKEQNPDKSYRVFQKVIEGGAKRGKWQAA